ncbi:hypothetical protein F4778DRAFT_343193 [Xylariomycetidae sp. FL2044]|nr:hypothetical protein F4778DRAFT_343193 [Xylariomycetidae sp. FL2044]
MRNSIYCGKSTSRKETSVSRYNPYGYVSRASLYIKICHLISSYLICLASGLGEASHSSLVQGNNRRSPNRASMGLLTTMTYKGANHVTNPVDRIYGVHAVVDKEDQEIIQRLKKQGGFYRNSRDIFRELARRWIAKHDSLYIICYTPISTGISEKNTRRKLPTWVPDWTEPTSTTVILLLVSQKGNFGPVGKHKKGGCNL